MLTAYNELLTLALDYVVMMDVGYSDCLVRVTSCCPLRCDVIRRRHDFVIIATIPDSVYMSGVGLCDDLIFAKSLQLNDRPVNMANCDRLLMRLRNIFFISLRAFVCRSTTFTFTRQYGTSLYFWQVIGLAIFVT